MSEAGAELEAQRVLVLGIGNVLWADEGFGVRSVEALYARYALPPGGAAADGFMAASNRSFSRMPTPGSSFSLVRSR